MTRCCEVRSGMRVLLPMCLHAAHHSACGSPAWLHLRSTSHVGYTLHRLYCYDTRISQARLLCTSDAGCLVVGNLWCTHHTVYLLAELGRQLGVSLYGTGCQFHWSDLADVLLRFLLVRFLFWTYYAEDRRLSTHPRCTALVVYSLYVTCMQHLCAQLATMQCNQVRWSCLTSKGEFNSVSYSAL